MSKNPPTLPGYFLTDEEQARRILAIAVGRQATRFVQDTTLSKIPLTDAQIKDGIKGKIVGKDGRNSRYFEEKSGVDLILNEQPNAVLLSSFDAFRREVARIALEKLVQDGRIQVSKIDEALSEAKVKIDQQVRQAGTQASQELGIIDLHPAVIRVLGTLKFRQSFGQNQLSHSVETAQLAASLALELGFDPILAKRAGLLHDLGKALDQTRDGGHALAGAEFAKKYGESAEVVQAIAAHHEESLPVSWLDHLVIAADALSGARPGARQGSTQSLLDRSHTIEKIALEFPAVTEAFAVQAGRELRVFVDGQKVEDSAVKTLAKEIADEISKRVQFPGEIKVTVLKEIRVVEVASR